MTKWSEIAKHIPGRVGKQVRCRILLCRAVAALPDLLFYSSAVSDG
jgi:hypothetical protein